MNKRYQVFVSSTYADLKDERSKVIQTLMEMDCIPAGMELFPAMDEEQFEFIKKVIDDCDYYLLILGARYGSIAEEDGLSYTEKEYRYAKEKGMKIIALVHGEPDQLPVAKTDKNPELYDKLVTFRKDVCTNRLIKYWHSAAELPGLVALNLPKTIKAYPAVGWVRGDNLSSNDALRELLLLKQENEALKKEIGDLSSSTHKQIKDIAGLGHNFKISGTMRDSVKFDPRAYSKEMTFGDIFKIISPKLISPMSDDDVRSYLGHEITKARYCTIAEECFQTIKIQFEALGLIELHVGNGDLLWGLTPLGKQTTIESIVVREK